MTVAYRITQSALLAVSFISTFALLAVLFFPISLEATVPVPLVIWHGLGDNYAADGLRAVENLYKEMYPGAFTHIIHLDDDPAKDRSATYFGNGNIHIQQICDALGDMPQLNAEAPHGIHAIGFSQGGIFMRSYVHRCNSPKVHTLVTFGSPHNGIADFVRCAPTDWICKSAFALLKSNKWGDWVQTNVIPAQYYRDPRDLDAYLDHSGLLADVNNERKEKNMTYADNMASLEGGFRMYAFDDENVVIPKESVWMGEVEDPDVEGDDRKVTWLKDRKMYKEDWLGLKKLAERGKLEFLTTGGGHMAIGDELLKDVFGKLWQPLGVRLRQISGKKYNPALATLAIQNQAEDGIKVQPGGAYRQFSG